MATTATSSTPPAPITATPVAVMLDASCPRSCLNTVLCLRLYPRHQGLRHRLGEWSRSFPNTDTALLLLLLGVNFITATTPTTPTNSTNSTTNSTAEWVWESSVCVVFLLENVFRWYIQWDGSARARAPLLKDTAVVGGLLCVLLLSSTTVVEVSTMVAVAKVVRATRTFRLLDLSPRASSVVATIQQQWRSLLNVFLLLGLVVFLYSIVGGFLFANDFQRGRNTTAW
jgi:magnesium-transporting ATPase (P-type)